jgi:pimeloyl-ACP methyl ester carboxylesterase
MPIAAEIYYHIYEGGDEGQKPPIVLIHGAGGNHLYWPSEVRRLPGFRVLALDLPGHGKSEGRGQQTIGAYSRCILDWMQETGLHSAVIVGHSMGGAIALDLALNNPQHVLGLGLLGAGARLSLEPELVERIMNPTTFPNAVETITSRSFSAQAPVQLTQLAAKRMAETRPSVLHSDFLACQAFDEADRVAEIRQPTLVICGVEDQITPPRSAQFLSSAMPNARLEMVPNAGHMVMLERPQAVARTLSGFLESFSY